MIDGHEALPALLDPPGESGGLLVEIVAADEGPFRGAETFRAVATVPR